MKTKNFDAIVLSSSDEKAILEHFIRHMKGCPIPDDEIMPNLGLFLTSKSLSRILFFFEIYQKILGNHGIIVEFGVRWGQTLSIMSALRGILEPFNRHRKIVGFDTFEGIKGMCDADGVLNNCKNGSFSVPEGYEAYLEKVMTLQENLNPMSHIKRFEIIKGDAIETVPEYFKKHSETIVSLAIFDFDIYKPTRVALETIKPHICKGTILVFDELCDPIFPGETVALREALGLNNVRVRRYPMTSRVSYLEIE